MKKMQFLAAMAAGMLLLAAACAQPNERDIKRAPESNEPNFIALDSMPMASDSATTIDSTTVETNETP